MREKLPERPHFSIPVLGDIPLIGPALFRQHPIVYLAIALVFGLIWFLYRSRAGLVLRSVGESPESAHALGYPVRRIRLLAVVVGGALCGLAGAYIGARIQSRMPDVLIRRLVGVLVIAIGARYLWSGLS